MQKLLDSVPSPAQLGARTSGWWLAGWQWMKGDCEQALAGTICRIRDVFKGRSSVACPGCLKKPAFYGSVFAAVTLLTVTFAYAQKQTVSADIYSGKEKPAVSFALPEKQASAEKQVEEQAGTEEQNGVEKQPGPDLPDNKLPATVQEQTPLKKDRPIAVNFKLQAAADTVNVRSEPDQNAPKIGQVHPRDILQARAKSSDGWYQIDFQGSSGWIAGWYVRAYQPKITASPDVASGDNPAGTTVSRGGSPDVLSFARRYLGKPYVYGAAGPSSFDCSGFVRYVYAHFDVELPHVADAQARAGKSVSSPAPGDLVFFSNSSSGYITHVGIFIGNNSFIHASSEGVTITSLDDPWYKKRYVKACRVN